MKTKHKILIAKAARAFFVGVNSLFGKSSECVVRRGGVQWFLDLNEGIDLFIYMFGKFEPETANCLQRLIKPGAICLDVGANIGAHLLPMARMVGSTGKVYGFEPTRFAYMKAKKNIELNPELASRIGLNQMLLTDGSVETVPAEIYSSWPLVDRGENLDEQHCGALKTTQGARSCSLDEWMGFSGVQRIDVMKLDVDGFEVQVLRGARKLLNRFRPTIVMELAPHVFHRPGETFEDLIAVLQECNYSLMNLQGASLQLDAGYLRSKITDGGSINVLATPGKTSAAQRESALSAAK